MLKKAGKHSIPNFPWQKLPWDIIRGPGASGRRTQGMQGSLGPGPGQSQPRGPVHQCPGRPGFGLWGREERNTTASPGSRPLGSPRRVCTPPATSPRPFLPLLLGRPPAAQRECNTNTIKMMDKLEEKHTQRSAETYSKTFVFE